MKSFRNGYALAGVLAALFLTMSWLGVLVTFLGHSGEGVNAHVRRVRARSRLLSLTCIGMNYLRKELDSGYLPHPPVVGGAERLSGFTLQRVFSSCDRDGGEVEIFDLDYDPANVDESKIDPLSWGPAYPGAYLIRAAVRDDETMPTMTAESVYIVVSYDIPEEAPAYLLIENPLFRRELLR